MDSHHSRRATSSTEFERAERTAKYILEKTRLRPTIGVVLGSGLGGFVTSLTGAVRIPYDKIEAFPRVTTEGHAGSVFIGKVAGVAAAVMQGRAHLYEGYSPSEVAFPMRTFRRMGIRMVILTNASGGIERTFRPGDLVLLRDHINLQGANPLMGPNDKRFGPRFPDMVHAYSESYRRIAKNEAKKLGIALREGVYAAVPGPSYETPAEIQYVKTIGADLIGMSTVAEAIAARHMQMGVLAISCVTNRAANLRSDQSTHEEVLEVARRSEKRLAALLTAVIPRMVATASQSASS